MLQLTLFRELNTEEGKMTHNFRPTQPLYDRQIYYNVGDSINELGDENAYDHSVEMNNEITQKSGSIQKKLDVSLSLLILLTTMYKINF